MEFVEHLKSSVDIVRVVGEYVRLRRVGAGPRYMGLCPFHTEKTPSFSVHSVHQFYKCFGCGKGGDVLNFVMEMESIPFFEALKLLAERNGIPMPRPQEYSDPETKIRTGLFEIYEFAAKAFRESLLSPAGAEARAYIEKRGVSAAAGEEFGLGYADGTGHGLLRRLQRQGFPAELIEESKLALQRDDGTFFDRFRNRLMFPIHNESGKVIAFGGRALGAGEEPKYLNSSETRLYKKQNVLYNLHRAKSAIRQHDRAVLVEGYMDVIGVYAAGIKEVVASCGTSLTNWQVRMLRRHSEHIVVNFDPDAAGADAAERSIKMLLDEAMRIRILELDNGLDPDEYVKELGPDAYRARLDRAGSYFHWLADRTRTKFDQRSAEGRIETLKSLLPAIQRVSDKLERMTIANEVAGYLGVEAGVVLDQFRKASGDRREPAPVAAPRQPVSDPERTLLKCLLDSAKIRQEIIPRLRELRPLQRFSTLRIFQSLFALYDGGSPCSYAELDARLDDGDKALLSSIVFADKLFKQEYTLDEAHSCVESLETAERERQRTELRVLLKEAERAGNLSEALRLAEELNHLAVSIFSLKDEPERR